MVEVVETEEQIKARKEELDYKIVNRNAVAIAETLTHHGKIMGEFYNEIESIKKENAMLRQELAQQKQMIIKALQFSCGHGSTA